jgi:glycerol-3-phosphate dehydrogenase
VLSLVGGKWTTFRASAEHLANRALDALARPRRRSTKGVPIGGGRGYPTTERARQRWLDAHARGVGRGRAAELLDRYGTVAADVIDAIVAAGRDAVLASAPGYSTGELRHLARTELVVHLDDVLMRRTSLAFTGGVDEESAAEVADAVGEVLGWDAATRVAEVERALASVHAADPAWARPAGVDATEVGSARASRR